MRKIKTFLALSPAERNLFVDVYLRLGLARVAVLIFPFSWLSRRWGVPLFEEFHYSHDDRDLLTRLSWALREASRNTPWKSNCLAKALAAKSWLRRKGITSTLYLGVATSDSNTQNEIEAHAWLRSGDTWITGYRASRGFTVVATYAELKNGEKIRRDAFLDVGEIIEKKSNFRK